MDGFDGFDDLAGDLGKAEETEAKGLRLTRFLQACEESLLAIELPDAAVDLPDDLAEDLEAEFKALAALVAPARAGDLAVVLASPLLEPLAKALARENVNSAIQVGLDSFNSELVVACGAILAAAPAGAPAAGRRVAVLLLAAASLQAYMRTNWTGPEIAADFCGPFEISTEADVGLHGSIFLEALQVDGEPIYELLRGLGYLWLACALLGILQPRRGNDGNFVEACHSSALAGGKTLAIWRARCAFAWQLSLAEASERGSGQSPWLFKLSVNDLVGGAQCAGPLTGAGFLSTEQIAAMRDITAPVLNTWRDASGKLVAPPGAPAKLDEQTSAVAEGDVSLSTDSLCETSPAVRTAILCELCQRLCWYGRTKNFDDMLQNASTPIDFVFEITGVKGIRRKYQWDKIAQLVVKTSSGAKGTLGKEAKAGEENQAPGNLQLLECDDMTDVLEGPKFDDITEEEREMLETPLTSAQQLVLLSKCQFVWTTSNPNDEMTLHIINALAHRMLMTFEKPVEDDEADGPRSTANWLTFSCGLHFRCRAEHHRSKTRERASFQLQALVDQFVDEKPSAAHRLLLVHSTGYSARFHLQREMGFRMMRLGMVSTAFEQFKKVKMWPDAIDCLMIAERKAECLDLVNGLLETSPTPRLWCALGDIESDRALECYEKAWEMSGKRNGRAVRSLGRYHFKKNDLAKAVEYFQIAVQINPLHSSIWFTCGVAQMHLERWDDAVLSLSRALGVDDDNCETWANLGGVHVQRKDFKQARYCFYEATKRARENWRMWESFMGVCMTLRDIQGVINAMRRILELGGGHRIPERQLGILTMSVISDAEGLYEGATGRKFTDKLMNFFKFATDTVASEPSYWRFLAELQTHTNQLADGLDSRLRQCRAEQARLWVQADPEKFGAWLSDLIACFEAIAETLDEPSLLEQARSQLQPFAYSVRNAEKQLQSKLDACTQVPEAWSQAHAKLDALAAKSEERVADCGISQAGYAAAEAA